MPEHIVFSERVYQSIGRECVMQKGRETGGVLIGCRLGPDTVVGFSGPAGLKAVQERTTFTPDHVDQQRFLDYTVDRNTYKHGKYTPGTRIPIYAPEKIWETKPDYLLILPWNLKDEIIEQCSFIREWGGEFVVPIPEVAVFS